jgi:hypothetical protein
MRVFALFVCLVTIACAVKKPPRKRVSAPAVVARPIQPLRPSRSNGAKKSYAEPSRYRDGGLSRAAKSAGKGKRKKKAARSVKEPIVRRKTHLRHIAQQGGLQASAPQARILIKEAKRKTKERIRAFAHEEEIKKKRDAEPRRQSLRAESKKGSLLFSVVVLCFFVLSTIDWFCCLCST